MCADASLEGEVEIKTKAGWNKWREVSGVICDKQMPVKLKGKVYKTMIRPAMLYGTETCALKVADERKMQVTEMRMLRGMLGKTRKDRIRNVEIRETVKVTDIADKMREKRLTWFGHVERREDSYVGKRVQKLELGGRGLRGRPKKRWREVVRDDMKALGIERSLVHDRAAWRAAVRKADPT